jgi:hypothetical protein
MPSDQEFLLYPLDTGEDPACLGCGALMVMAAHEVRASDPDFISFRCPKLRAVRKIHLRGLTTTARATLFVAILFLSFFKLIFPRKNGQG